MIYDLLLTFTGPKGCDSTGVPLRNSDRIWDIWDCQQCHIACIQDPADVQPYTKTRQLTKGDLTLPTYRSARGSTSLESFHLHINRFIPGTLKKNCLASLFEICFSSNVLFLSLSFKVLLQVQSTFNSTC